MIYRDNTTPLMLASRLAKYISDPSTIRVRVLDHFGRAPSLEQCRNLRMRAMQKAKATEYNDRFKTRCLRHDGPYVLGEDGNERCGPCEDEKQAKAREKAKERLRLRLEREENERRAKQEEAERQKLAARREYEELLSVQAALESTGKPVLAGEVIRAVAAEFMITPAELIANNRQRIYVDARTAAIRIFRRRGNSYPQIGKRLKRDHSSIINLDNSFSIRAKRNPLIAEVVERYS